MLETIQAAWPNVVPMHSKSRPNERKDENSTDRTFSTVTRQGWLGAGLEPHGVPEDSVHYHYIGTFRAQGIPDHGYGDHEMG